MNSPLPQAGHGKRPPVEKSISRSKRDRERTGRDRCRAWHVPRPNPQGQRVPARAPRSRPLRHVARHHRRARSGSPGGWPHPHSVTAARPLGRASERRWLRGDGFETPSRGGRTPTQDSEEALFCKNLDYYAESEIMRQPPFSTFTTAALSNMDLRRREPIHFPYYLGPRDRAGGLQIKLIMPNHFTDLDIRCQSVSGRDFRRTIDERNAP